ncbi:MAG: FlaD/FlaE family flagellar protein, partial [Haloarculaceae archaeon]
TVDEADTVDEDVITFDDVVADLEGGEGESTPEASDEPLGAVAPEGDERRSTGPASDAIDPADTGDLSTANGDRTAGRHAGAGGSTRTPYLAELPDSYATDVLALEWLAELVETTGPAAALKAVAYYEDVGWIAPAVSGDLEEYLAGPGIDVHVDPNDPEELAVEDHATSYEYILKLDEIRELEHTA